MAAVDLEALRAFRAGVYVCLGRRRDALFELRDAVLTAGPCPSLPHLSLAPGHRGGWGSVSAALRRGHVHVEALRALLLRRPAPEGPPLDAVDVSVWPRPGATTSPERGYQYHAPRRRDGRDPVVPGWAYQWLTRLSWDRDSWTAPVDVRRVRPEERPEEQPPAVAVEQLKALVAARPAAQRGEVPLVVFDAGYDACGFTHALAGAPVAVLIRLRSNRHFWFAPVRTTAPPRGRPKRHGATFVCNDPATWPAPTAELHVTDEASGQVQVRAWAGLHIDVRRPLRPGVVGQYRGPGGAPTAPWCAWRSAASPAGGAPRTWSGSGGSPRRAASRGRPPPRTRTPCGGGTAGEPIWSKPSDSSNRCCGGSPRGCACPSKPTAGPGWCSPPPRSCAWPAAPSPTTACRGSARTRRPATRPHGCTCRPHSHRNAAQLCAAHRHHCGECAYRHRLRVPVG
jgi:hypothetical protein